MYKRQPLGFGLLAGAYVGSNPAAVAAELGAGEQPEAEGGEVRGVVKRDVQRQGGYYGYPTVFCVTIRNRDLCVDLRYLTD